MCAKWLASGRPVFRAVAGVGVPRIGLGRVCRRGRVAMLRRRYAIPHPSTTPLQVRMRNLRSEGLSTRTILAGLMSDGVRNPGNASRLSRRAATYPRLRRCIPLGSAQGAVSHTFLWKDAKHPCSICAVVQAVRVGAREVVCPARGAEGLWRLAALTAAGRGPRLNSGGVDMPVLIGRAGSMANHVRYEER